MRQIYWLHYFIFCFWQIVAQQDRSCATFAGSLKHGRDLPVLLDQFKCSLEVKDIQHGYSRDISVYYDFKNNKGAMYESKMGQEIIVLNDFSNRETYFIQNGTCKTSIPEEHDIFSIIKYKGAGHIGRIADLFNFGATYNESFVSENETVRGIPVEHWEACIERTNTINKLDFFFSSPEYLSAAGKFQVPVRVISKELSRSEERNTKTTDSYRIFDFFAYQPGPIENKEVFQVPSGVICKHTKSRKPLPVLPSRFGIDVEVVKPQYNVISASKHFYDHDHNISRIDMIPSMNMTHYGNRFGYRPLRVIDDFTSGLEYVIDDELRNCTVTSIHESLDAVYDYKTHTVTMRSPYQLFYMDQFKLKYKGQRKIRDILCDVWAGEVSNWPQNSNSIMEVAYSQPTWSVDGSAKSENPVLMNIWVQTRHQDGEVTDYISHITHYSEGHQLLSAFDISPCYDQLTGMVHFMFQIPGNYGMVSQNRMDLEPAVRRAVAHAAGIRPIRITNLRYEQNAVDYIDLWMTMLDKANIKGNVLWAPEERSLQEAFKQLLAKIQDEHGLVIEVEGETQNLSLTVRKGSLRTDDMVEDARRRDSPSTDEQTDTEVSGTQSVGAMVGLAIGMLATGLLVGLAIGFFIWKFGTGIPYQVQD